MRDFETLKPLDDMDTEHQNECIYEMCRRLFMRISTLHQYRSKGLPERFAYSPIIKKIIDDYSC